MKAGRLCHRIKVIALEQTADNYGGSTEEEKLIAEVWASVEPLRGQKLFEAQQVNAKTDTKILLRYLDSIGPAQVIGFGAKRYRILSIINTNEKNYEMTLMCEALPREEGSATDPQPEPDPEPTPP